MMDTEERAKGKWCPQREHTRAIADTFYRVQGMEPTDTEQSNLCIASDCAMWRWQDSELPPIKGFCGLGGWSYG